MEGVASSDLPEGWVSAYDPTYKRIYYFDTRERRSTWTKPQSSPSSQSSHFEKLYKPDNSLASSVSTSTNDTESNNAGEYVPSLNRKREEQEQLQRQKSISITKRLEQPDHEQDYPMKGEKNTWIQLYSKEHQRKYYYNRITKESVWNNPYVYSSKLKVETASESDDDYLRDVPSLQNAWNQIEKAREDIKREREEIQSRLRTDAKLLQACLDEFSRLRKEHQFTPANVPDEVMDGFESKVEKINDEDDYDEADLNDKHGILESLREELDKYSKDLEKRSARMSNKNLQQGMEDSETETETETDEIFENLDPETKKALHKKRIAKKKAMQGPDSLVLFMDIEQEIKGVMEEMKAREQAKKQAAQVKEGDYYRVLGVGRRVTPAELKRAYHKLMIKWHPDKNPDNLEEAKEKSNLVTDAYQVLNDPWEREIYDWLGLEEYLIHSKTLQAFKNYMWSGIRIKKHGRNGKRYGIKGMLTFYPAKRRMLWLDFHCKSLNTGPHRILEAQTAKERNSIKRVTMDAITEVRKGISTDVFERTGIYSRQKLYLSIISPERTLDIETESPEQREFLASRISVLVYDLQKNKEKLFKHYKENPIKKKKKKRKSFNHRRRRN